MTHSHKNIRSSQGFAFGALALMISGCAFQTYSPKPLDPVQGMQQYRAHDPNSADFQIYAKSQGYPTEQWPIRQWGLRELTLSALFFHPQLDVARAQLQASQAKEITAGQRRDPSISATLGKSEDEEAPWIYSLGLDIPIQTANKRELSIELARSLSEAARIEIGQAAWNVRSRLLASWIDYNAALHQAAAIQQEVDIRSEITDMLDKRLQVGMISNTDLSNARLLLQQAQQLLITEQGRIPALKTALAINAGLVPEMLEQLQLATPSLEALLEAQHQVKLARYGSDALQDAALLNRLDIRAALARYEAAERKLRLEIARQYPDLTLSPSRIYEEGYHIWQLGIGALLPLLNKNKGLIAEARALRELEATQFEALQANVIGNVAQAKASYYGAADTLQQAREQYAARQRQMQRIQKQFDEGYADRLELAQGRLENLRSLQNMINAEYAVQRAAAALEDALQQPLEFVESLPDDMEQASPAGSKEPSSQESHS
jgi:outer membrane protein, heavy metal efflux system